MQTDAMETFVAEGKNFAKRHTDIGAGAIVAGFAWGLLCALAECPECPGIYRLPSDEEWTRLTCPRCRQVWVYQGE